MFQLEGQNSLLVRENAELQAQVLTLRQRLLSLPANAAKEIYRLSIQVCLCRVLWMDVCGILLWKVGIFMISIAGTNFTENDGGWYQQNWSEATITSVLGLQGKVYVYSMMCLL